MDRPATIAGAAFGVRSDGDARTDRDARERLSRTLGIPSDWATMHQVHGTTVAVTASPRHVGDADAMITRASGVPLVVATADCVPLVLGGRRTMAVVHAGWRGVAAGVISAALEQMSELGDPAVRAVVGPHIGPCCYEVGPEVVSAVGHPGTTTWGTTSVDLGSAVGEQLDGVRVERIAGCTHHDTRYASYRRDGTSDRQVTVAWLT